MCSICLARNDWNTTFHLAGEISSDEKRHYIGSTSQGSTGDAVVDGLISGVKWDGLSISYNFPVSNSLYGATYSDPAATTGFAPLDGSMQSMARTAFGMISRFTNASFNELPATTAGAAVDIALGQSTDPETAFGYYPSGSQAGGDIWIGRGTNYQTSGDQFANPVLGDYSYMTFLHEIGHAMGLKHSHESGGIAGAVIASRDAMEFSLMSYRSSIGAPTNGNYSNETYGYAQTFMMLDIAALQEMYGADYGMNSSDSVYTFNPATGEMLINGVGQGTPGGNRIFRTIWDGNGNDTYDTSNYSADQNISLAAGGWSLFSTTQRAELGTNSYARANAYNALLVDGVTSSLIENAITGVGNDTLGGNQVANFMNGQNGNDKLVGHGNDDILIGGEGDDTLYGDFEPSAPPAAPLAAPYSLGGAYATVSQSTTRNSTATAINMSGNVSFAADSDITNSTTIAHSTVNATANGFADWYRVTLNATNRLTVDIDHTSSGYDSFVRIIASNGTTQLMKGDDSTGDPGSAVTQDAFLTFTAQTTATYYIVVGSYLAPSTIAAGAVYELNVSTDVTPIAVDVPNTLGVAGNDTLVGGIGNDTLIGGDGTDMAVFNYSGTLPLSYGVKWGGNAADFKYSFGTEGTDTLQGIETVRLVQSGGGATDYAAAQLTQYFGGEALGINAYGTSGASGGWADNDLYTRRIGDVNGDTRADIIAFGSDFTYVSLGQASGTFAGPIIGINSFGSGAAGGSWVSDNVYKRQLADVNGDGRDDIVGFGSDYTYVSLGQGNGTFAATIIGINSFGASVPAGGWTNNNLYARELADVNGDGRADIVGFGSDYTYVALGQANGTFANPIIGIAGFGASAAGGGWTSNDQFPRFVGDISGDGRADIVGFGGAGVYISLGQADGTFAATTLGTTQFSQNSGWSSQTALPRMLGDLNADGRMDLIGFGSAGTYGALALPDGTGFTQAAVMTTSFGAGPADGLWDSNLINPRMVGDIDADGRADLIGFGATGAITAINSTDFFVI
jgi:FG-GAP-like repeat/Peptidase M10 serralysin C terminal/Bacterial pre-peptidase C-terminal domain/Metallo-peptidase family M12B Reprolysin-like/RTX calcium-binding nonapeptide repeat (4 copies)